MILDTIDNYHSYIHLHTSLGRVSEYLCTTDFSKAAASEKKEDAYTKTHNKYIDIQMPIDGTEKIRYIPRSEYKTIKNLDMIDS